MITPSLHPLDLLPDQALDSTYLELTAPLPDWLSGASPQVLETFSELLCAFHVCASALEQHIDAVLPSFADYTSEQLAARIKADLGVEVDPDRVILDIPHRVWRDYDIDPQFGNVKSYAAPWVASTEREQYSLCELARLNFAADDEQMARRLELAESELNGPRYIEAGLSAAYLYDLIPRLDVAQGYRALLTSIFSVPREGDQAAQRHANLLLEPYERKILLEAFCATTRHRLTQDGHRLVEIAALARSRAETDAANIEMTWLVFKPRHDESSEDVSLTLNGLCGIRDTLSGRTVLYLPDAPGNVTFIEGAGINQVRQRLIQQLISKPQLIDYLAERTADHESRALHVSYIKQALIRGFDAFIGFVPAVDMQMAQRELQTRAELLYQLNETQARSAFDLDRQRNKEQNALYQGYLLAVLGFLPGVGTLISVRDGWNDGHEAAKAFDEGNLNDGLLAAGRAALSVLDVVLSLVPGAASVRFLTRYGTGAARLKSLVSVARRYEIQPFAGYEVQKTLTDAIPQAGRDAGTLLHDGQLWIQHQGQAYGVYRRGGEQTLRLKKSVAHGYEPPVRYQEGQWVYHNDVGLKGGGKSYIAEILIAEANPDPAFKRPQARQLLDEFSFPADEQLGLELKIATHYQTHRAIPDWAEQHRRTGAAPQPEAASGSGTNKRKDAPGEQSGAKRVVASSSASHSAYVANPDLWKSWGQPLKDPASFVRTDAVQPIFRDIAEQGCLFIQLNGLRYDILPLGGTPHRSIVFLKAPGRLDESLSGLNLSTRELHLQPVMASFHQGAWTVYPPVFKRAIHRMIEQGRPGFTPASYQILARKLFDYADPGQAGLTGTRLINIKDTLNAWRKGEKARLPGMNDPLLMLEGARPVNPGTAYPSLNVGTGPSLATFNRLDFLIADDVLQEKLLLAVAEPGHSNASRTTLRDLMSTVMTKAGYTLICPDDAALQRHTMLLFRREGVEQIYLLKLQRFSSSSFKFQGPGADRGIFMSNLWLRRWLSRQLEVEVVTTISQALQQNRLVKLLGGLKVTGSTRSSHQVFVQRLADNF